MLSDLKNVALNYLGTTVILFVLVYSSMHFINGYSTYIDAQNHLNKHVSLNQNLIDSVNFYKKRIARLSENIDPDFLDERAREILGVQEIGEEVYYY